MTDLQNILAEFADGFILGALTADDLIKKYQLTADSDIAELLKLAQMLENIFVPVQPSAAFVDQLREELASEPQAWLERLRQMTRLQMAAGIAGIGGITGLTVAAVWWATRSRRSLLGEEALAS